MWPRSHSAMWPTDLIPPVGSCTAERCHRQYARLAWSTGACNVKLMHVLSSLQSINDVWLHDVWTLPHSKCRAFCINHARIEHHCTVQGWRAWRYVCPPFYDIHFGMSGMLAKKSLLLHCHVRVLPKQFICDVDITRYDS